MSRFVVRSTPLEGLLVLERQPHGDHRGQFERLFCTTELAPVLADRVVKQVNRSYTSRAGAVRGMHFQRAPHAELKLVSCLRGAVFDVAVDLRRGSPTLLKWHSVKLTADNHLALAIPEGFAHGFQTLTDDCELLYFHTASYEVGAEGGVNPMDPLLGIHWPSPIQDLSERDRGHAHLSEEFHGIDP